ncbi:MAG: hypothetical protein R2911_43780 [Caldilineaceae bacterium]
MLATLREATTIIGGGDSGGGRGLAGLTEKMSHVSTGGGNQPRDSGRQRAAGRHCAQR